MGTCLDMQGSFDHRVWSQFWGVKTKCGLRLVHTAADELLEAAAAAAELSEIAPGRPSTPISLEQVVYVTARSAWESPES